MEKTKENAISRLLSKALHWIVNLPDIIKNGVIPFIKNIDWVNVPVYTYVRWIMAIVLALNSVLTGLGINPIPASESELYEVISNILSFANMFVLIMNTYKNNSTSKEALLADQLLKALKTAELFDEEGAMNDIHDIIDNLVGKGDYEEPEDDLDVEHFEGNPEEEGNPIIPGMGCSVEEEIIIEKEEEVSEEEITPPAPEPVEELNTGASNDEEPKPEVSTDNTEEEIPPLVEETPVEPEVNEDVEDSDSSNDEKPVPSTEEVENTDVTTEETEEVDEPPVEEVKEEEAPPVVEEKEEIPEEAEVPMEEEKTEEE